MTHFRHVCGRLAAALLVCGLTTSCDDFAAENLKFGTVTPDARLQITFHEPIRREDVYARLRDIMVSTGFPDGRGDIPIAGQAITAGISRGWEWHPSPSSNHTDRDPSISTNWKEVTDAPSGFRFTFRQGGTHPFEEKEWLLFFKFKEELLPSVFPNATIDVSRHPAENTDINRLAEISKATGIPVPEYVKSRYQEMTGSELD